MLEHLSNAEQLKEIFRIGDLSSTYKNYTVLANRTVGFSIDREYPKDIRFKTPYNVRGVPDVVALIHVVYAHPNDFGERAIGERVPIFLAVLSYSKYISVHQRYNFDDPECPTKESVSNSESTPRPIDIRDIEDYYYDHKTNSLQNKKGRVISGERILNYMFSDHCKTVNRVARMRIGILLAINDIRIRISGKLISALKYILEKLFGQKLTTSDGFYGILRPYRKEDVKMERREVINILGYKASRKVILTFCFLYVLIFSSIFVFRLKSSYIEYLTSNNLLVICTAICSLWILDYIVPKLLFSFINHFLKNRKKLLFKNFRV